METQKKKKTGRVSCRITVENEEFLDTFKNKSQVLNRALDRYRRDLLKIGNMKKRIEGAVNA